MATSPRKLLTDIGMVAGLLGFISLASDGVSYATSPPTGFDLDSSLGKEVSVCQKGPGGLPGGRVWFFKQWHLAPSVNTSDIEKSKGLPQYANQSAIYNQLNTWISLGKVKTVIAEGCGGEKTPQKTTEMTQKTDAHFNGWDMASLKSHLVPAKTYDKILTSIPLKLEAKYGDKIHTLCGDDEALLKKNALAFSDARGELGYLGRLEHYKNDPERAKLYLDGVIELYHLPAGTTSAQAVSRLNTELEKSVNEAEQWIQKRNEHLVDVISAAPRDSDIAVVFGGAHASGVEALLEKKGMNCTIVEPVGYQDDETQLLQKLKELLAQRQGK
jgi:hypothetical protein